MSPSPPASADHTLALWEAEEAALPPPPEASTLSPQERAALTGLQQLQALLDGRLPGVPMARTLNYRLVQVAFGRAVFQGRPSRTHYNPMGSVHGGWFATLLDSAVGCAVHSSLPVGKSYTTLELKLNLVRPLTEAVPLVRAEGHLVHGGRQVATAEGRLVGHDGRLYAHASTTCLILQARPPRPAPG